MGDVGIGLGDTIKTYGDLCEAIENTEEAIEKVRRQLGFEQGDEMDLELHLLYLKKLKKKHERIWTLEKELGIYSCDKCDSIHLDKIKKFSPESRSYILNIECNDCGYQKEEIIPEAKITELLTLEVSSVWDDIWR